MLKYKIYVLSNEGLPILYYDYQGLNDACALVEANKYAGKSAIEVRQQSRLVARLLKGEASVSR